MPRYFFDFDDGVAIPDRDGEDLPDDEAARAEAKRIAFAYAASPTMFAADGGALVVSVRDEAGWRVATVRLALSVGLE